MKPKNLLRECEKRSVHLFVTPNGGLAFEGPQQALKEMGTELKEHKSEIVAMIFDYQGEVDRCVSEFNRQGIRLTEYTQEIRHKSFLIEQEIHEAAEVKDRTRFLELLDQWQSCFNPESRPNGTASSPVFR